MSHSDLELHEVKLDVVDNVTHSAGSVCRGLHAHADEVVHTNQTVRCKLWTVVLLCFLFMVGEVVGGLYAGSLAILTDAAHLLSDLAGFLIGIFALWWSSKSPTARHSFGFHRAEILGALLSVLLIWLIAGILLYEAVDRILHPQTVDGRLMFIVAAAGLGVNLLMGTVLHSTTVHGHGHTHSHGANAHTFSHAHTHHHHHHNHHGHGHHPHPETKRPPPDDHPIHHADGGDTNVSENVNVRAAFIHVLGDCLQSVGVMVAGAIIWARPDYHLADPICTFLFSVIVLFTTVQLVAQSLRVLMEASPENIDSDEVEKRLASMPNVVGVHDLHIWSLSMGKPSLSVHLLVRNDGRGVLEAVNEMLLARYRINHSTIQIELVSDQISCNPHYQAQQKTSREPTQPLR